MGTTPLSLSARFEPVRRPDFRATPFDQIGTPPFIVFDRGVLGGPGGFRKRGKKPVRLPFPGPAFRRTSERRTIPRGDADRRKVHAPIIGKPQANPTGERRGTFWQKTKEFVKSHGGLITLGVVGLIGFSFIRHRMKRRATG